MTRLFGNSSYQKLKEEDDIQHTTTVYSKVVLFGPSGSGKTRVARALSGGSLEEITEATIGCTYLEDKKTKNVHLQLWDVGSAERFSSIWPMYLRGAQQLILTFDQNNQASFDELSYFCDKIKQYAPNAKLILAGVQPNSESVVTEQAIHTFMKQHDIQQYYPVDPKNSEQVANLHNGLVANAKPQPVVESESTLQAKEVAKESIELLRTLASKESDEHFQIIQSICKLLDKALLSENVTHYFSINTPLIEDQLTQLRYASSSLYSSACNAITTVLVCCTILATGFTALFWLYKVLKDNLEQKGNAFLFSTSGAKQLAQEATHKTIHTASPGKK